MKSVTGLINIPRRVIWAGCDVTDTAGLMGAIVTNGDTVDLN